MAALLIVGLWLAGFAGFVAALPRGGAEPSPGDCIAVFTGRMARVHAGFDLLQGWGRGRIMVSGVGEGANPQEMAAVRARWPGLFACCAAVGTRARDTRDNAREVAAWARREGCRDLVLVTDDVHMPRSRLLLRARLDAVPIRPFSVPHLADEGRLQALFHAQAWREYHKFLASLPLALLAAD